MDDFAGNNLLAEMGLDGLSEEDKTEVALTISRIIQQNVILRVLDALSEEDKNEFDALLSEKGQNQEEVLAFLQSKIPNLDAIVDEEIAKFKKDGAELMKNIGK